MDQIIKQIDNTVYWIRVDQKKMHILTKGNCKKETKRIIKKMVVEEYNNLKYALINRLIIKFHNDKKIYNNGIMSFHINNYQVLNNNLKKIFLENKDGFIWFEKEWLLENGWDKKYISNTLQMLRKNKGKILIPGINYYHLFGKN